MAEKDLQITNHDFLIYRDSNNDVKVSVMLINNDIWLTQNLIAELFGVLLNIIIYFWNKVNKKLILYNNINFLSNGELYKFIKVHALSHFAKKRAVKKARDKKKEEAQK